MTEVGPGVRVVTAHTIYEDVPAERFDAWRIMAERKGQLDLDALLAGSEVRRVEVSPRDGAWSCDVTGRGREQRIVTYALTVGTVPATELRD